jgi:hypothetical protein
MKGNDSQGEEYCTHNATIEFQKSSHIIKKNYGIKENYLNVIIINLFKINLII